VFSFLFAFLIVGAVTTLAIFGSERWGAGFLILLGFALVSGWMFRRITGPIHDNSPMGGLGSYLAHEFLGGYLIAVAVSLAGLLWYRARTRR
jgi:hypothetical protein